MKYLDPKYLVFVLCFCIYVYLGFYFNRENFLPLLLLVSVLFVSFYYLFKKSSENELLKMGLLFRVVLFFSTPFLSQDFYRFIWDGNLIKLSISPYQHIPADIISYIDIYDPDHSFQYANFLYQKMGNLSQEHYSNYPPVNQLIFFLSSIFSNNSIIPSVLFLKAIIFFSDIGILYFGKKILHFFQLDSKNIFLYYLNPLVLIELQGNLHFEGLMLFFFVVSIYLLTQKKWQLAAFIFGLSIATKLIPLLVLPIFFKNLKFKKALLFYIIALGTFILSFIPLLTPKIINNYSNTISLWFVNFEFNASIYNIIRYIGFQVKGYNIIKEIGWILPIISVSWILYVAFFRKNTNLNQVIKNNLFALTIYFFLSTTVHPWYIINLLLLGILTNLKYPIIWSFTVFLSYYAYSNSNFQENFWLIGIEYGLVVCSFFYFDWKKKWSSNIVST